MRISDWSSDVCSSDLGEFTQFDEQPLASASVAQTYSASLLDGADVIIKVRRPGTAARMEADVRLLTRLAAVAEDRSPEIARYRPVEFLRTFGRNLAWEMDLARSEEHTSELQSLMRISYAVFCLKKKKISNTQPVL